MRARRVVHKEFNDGQDFMRFVGKTLENVADQHTHNTLGFLVLVLDNTLFHGTPGRTKAMADACKRSVFLEKGILKFHAAISTEEHGNSAASKHAFSEGTTNFGRYQARNRFQDNGLAQTTDVRHNIGAAVLVSRGRWSFHIDHDLFPTALLRINDWLLFLFLRLSADFLTSKTLLTPFLVVLFHGTPETTA